MTKHRLVYNLKNHFNLILITRIILYKILILNPIQSRGGGADLSPSSLIKEKNLFSNSYISRTKWLRYLNWIIIWRFLGELSLAHFWACDSHQELRKKLGADLPLPPPWVLKGPKSAGLYWVKITFTSIITMLHLLSGGYPLGWSWVNDQTWWAR